jgi:hypothetical protein
LDRANVGDRVNLVFDVHHVLVFEAAHHVCHRVDLTNVGQELIAQAFTLGWAAHETRDVHEANTGQDLFVGAVHLGQRADARVWPRNDADVRLIVQNGKFAASALAFDSELNKVLLPTFGRPTIPQEKPIARLA